MKAGVIFALVAGVALAGGTAASGLFRPRPAPCFAASVPGIFRRAALTRRAARGRLLPKRGSWIGTPYHHMGRVKGAGADCLTLLAEIYERAGVIRAYRGAVLSAGLAPAPRRRALPRGIARPCARVRRAAGAWRRGAVQDGAVLCARRDRHGLAEADPRARRRRGARRRREARRAARPRGEVFRPVLPDPCP